MTITVRKDPTRRLGGWALVGFQGAPAGPVLLAIERDEGALHLGPHGWQGAPHDFGPYPVENDASGQFIRVGPDVVNHMEPYLTVSLVLPDLGVRHQLSWPDEVIPAPDSYEGGGVGNMQTIAPQPVQQHLREIEDTPQPPPEEPAPVEEPPVQVEPPVEEPPVVEPPVIVDPPEEPEEKSGGNWLLPALLAGLLFLIAGAGLVYLYWDEINEFIEANMQQGEDPPPDPVDPPEPVDPPDPPDEEDPLPPPGGDTDPPDQQAGPPACTPESVTESASDPDRLRQITELCRGENNVRVEIEALDRMPSSPEKNYRWGQLNDPSRDPVEGVPFQPDAETAARYYRRAKQEGSVEAARALEQLCEWLGNQTSPSAGATRARHCQ